MRVIVESDMYAKPLEKLDVQEGKKSKFM